MRATAPLIYLMPREGYMILYKKMVQKYWKENYPKEAARMIRQGTFDQQSEEVAETALDALIRLHGRGTQRAAVREMVIQEYIFQPPPGITE